MDLYLFVKTLHIISATIVFGTAIGIANFMFCGHRSALAQGRVFAARMTVKADFLFTLPSVILQPVSGSMARLTRGLLLERHLAGLDLWSLSAGGSLLGAGRHHSDADESDAGGPIAWRGFRRGNL